MTKQILIVSTLIVLVVLAPLLLVNAEASNAGFEDGKRSGVNDYQNGRSFNDDCSSSNGLYCLAYMAGYRFGYEAANSIR